MNIETEMGWAKKNLKQLGIDYPDKVDREREMEESICLQPLAPQ